MRSVVQHQEAVAELMRPVFERLESEAEEVELADARGRVLAADLFATIDLPAFDNSQMDGYAVRSAEAVNPLPTVQPIPAGSAQTVLATGTAAAIMTGAMIPAGADAVVPIEACLPDHFVAAGEQVSFAAVPLGQFIRKAGSDIAAGTVALSAGTRLNPAQLALAAALGTASVRVRRRLKVAILSTGDELIAPGEALRPGAIYEANSTLLAAALRETGAMAVILPTASDDPAVLARTLASVQDVDLLISTGGVSEGAYEVVKQTLASSAQFEVIAMQPGGPQATGMIELASSGKLAFLGFPGNPVSTLISFEMFLRPLLMGARLKVSAALSSAASSPAAKHQIRRALFSQGTGLNVGSVQLLGGPGSHLLHAMAQANALVHFPVGVADVSAGEEVEVWLL
ncbi:molybdopterin biosynthesis protein [Renibacterium salmoninarum ATCC 33209]|uniref:Molybdopterin molybdenumtransferase n=1 Tax=Renibacterium salmoninarum (strain ATCC 33209 / DSM 20767 / JCM 11484 / NBRC 15589 / NCIMB 2235) TaxID=288705 RepID=A9WPZ5_RENSM|nr:gephyrin-like molybdotransferase Glp [Renibacterium salmoninarum]ABY22440.1 molybdopterin biosynthesis protein [Renibacterium salmoninarum ATCC 33209]